MMRAPSMLLVRGRQSRNGNVWFRLDSATEASQKH
jgi:hypothetical protein